jgi:hypothetical protein
MIERIAKAGPLGVVTNQAEKLPYSIELWDSGGQALERVLARALNAQLARAIFQAAQKEHPESRILLRRGARTVADSAE